MADGVSTRLQRDVLHQQQELERIETKIDTGLSQLKVEIEKMGIEMRSMFEELLAKDAAHSRGALMRVTTSDTGKDGIGSF